MNAFNYNSVEAKPKARTRIPAWYRLQAGFSLIELMVAITLGLIISAALIALFVNITHTNSEMAKTNSQIENGRFTAQLLQLDIAHAGFWGSYVPQFDDLTASTVTPPDDVPSTDLIVNPSYLATDDPTLLPCKAYAGWGTTYKKFLLGIPVQAYAYDGVPAGCGAVVTDIKANTDVLVVRHAETCVAGSGGNCEADIGGRLYFQSSQCELEISSGLRYLLDTAGFNIFHKRNCTTVAEKRKFISHIYYISNNAGIPTLMLSQFDSAGGALAHQAAIPLIEGIEGFRVELGIDNISDNGTNIITDANPANRYTAAIKWADPDNHISPTNRGDGVPDVFVRCTTAGAAPCTAAQLTNVVAVKLYVLARAETATLGYTDSKTYTLGSTTLGPYGDGFKRHVFSTTVRLNNTSMRRATPP